MLFYSIYLGCTACWYSKRRHCFVSRSRSAGGPYITGRRRTAVAANLRWEPVLTRVFAVGTSPRNLEELDGWKWLARDSNLRRRLFWAGRHYLQSADRQALCLGIWHLWIFTGPCILHGPQPERVSFDVIWFRDCWHYIYCILLRGCLFILFAAVDVPRSQFHAMLVPPWPLCRLEWHLLPEHQRGRSVSSSLC